MPASSAMAGAAARPSASAAPASVERGNLIGVILDLGLGGSTYRYLTRLVNIVLANPQRREQADNSTGGKIKIEAARNSSGWLISPSDHWGGLQAVEEH